MSKKWLALLALILAAVLFVSASAVAATPDGSEENPYLVSTQAQLHAYLMNTQKGPIYIQLTSNIELTKKYTITTNKDFVIDGNNQYGFLGVQGNPIWNPSKLTNKDNYTKYQHLVGINTQDFSATFKNLFFDGGNVAPGVNVYVASDVTMDNVTLTNFKSAQAAMTVNGSNVVAINSFKVLNTNCTIAIDVSKGSGVTKTPSFTMLCPGKVEGLLWGTGDKYLEGGSFSKKPDDKYLAEGYETVQGTDKLWTVVPKTYTVTFAEMDGTVIAQQSVTHGSSVNLLAPPYRAGYSFGGWHVDSACTQPYAGGAATGDLTLYALWEELPATGDAAPLGMLASLAILSACAMFILRKRSA